MKKILSVNNLKKVYGSDTLALKGVSFDVYEGEFVVIIGLSGSGKSTLLRCINRLIKPTEGRIEFLEKSLDHANKKELRAARREIGMIFQHYNLIDRTSVLENVLHGRLGYMNDFHGLLKLYSQEDRRKALNILERVGLEKEVYKRADQLSGGQKQRVAISRALAQNPSLMLADEPIASLDPVSSGVVMDYLHNICTEDGISAIVSLHQVDFAFKYASRIIGIRDGLVAYDGAPEDLTEEMVQDIYKKNNQENDIDNIEAIKVREAVAI